MFKTISINGSSVILWTIIISFVTSDIVGQDFSPCPQTISADDEIIYTLIPYSRKFESEGILINENYSESGQRAKCEYQFEWIENFRLDSEPVPSTAFTSDYKMDFFIDLNHRNKPCSPSASLWSMELIPGFNTVQSFSLSYRVPDYRIATVWHSSDTIGFSLDRIKGITEKIAEELIPYAYPTGCIFSPKDSIPTIDLSSITLTPPCSSETYNTLMKNAWPEIGDVDYTFFLAESNEVPEEDVLVRYYLSTDPELSSDDRVLTDFTIPASEFILNDSIGNYIFGDIIEFFVDGAISEEDPDILATISMDDISPGTYYLIEYIDPENDIEEINEENNISPGQNAIVISEFVGGDCNCCPSTITDEQGAIGELITDVPASMYSSTAGRVIYRTDSDSYMASCGYRMTSGGNNGKSYEIGEISWQDKDDLIRTTVDANGSDRDFCDLEGAHDLRPGLVMLGAYERFSSQIPISLMEEHNGILANEYQERSAPRSLLCLNKECDGYLDSNIVNTDILIYDANPQFISLGIFGTGRITNIREISDETDLEDSVMKVRKAVSCDGVSEVLLRAPVSSESAFAVWELEDEKYGKIETPWASRTVEISGQHYVYAIYTPPVSLSELTPEKNQTGILSAKIPINFGYEHESNLVESIFNIEVVAPPVVLVHGTFDNPDNCWNTPLTEDASITLTKQLEEEGIKYWTVDYSQSNGSQESSFLLDMESSFEANQKVVYENEGGIKEAIESYRRDFDYAATKADVIGHSMGGVLPRVYAATPDYNRTENFNAGDINRLISIASTHHGSDLSYFGHFFNESWSDMELPLQQRLANTVFIYGQWLISGMAETDAVRNQLPASTELRAIGPTDIPCHAVICTISDFEDIRNDLGDQDTKQYEDLFEGLASVFYFYPGGITGFFLNLIRTYKRHPESQTPLLTGSDFPAIPNDRVNMLRRGSDINEVADQVAEVFSNQWESWQILMEDENSTWIVDEDRYVLPYEFTESNYFDTDDNSRTYISEKQYDLLSGEERQEKFDPAVDFEYRDRVIDYLRYIIFRNDLNDGVVRYQSQRGGLEEQYITHFNKNLHGYAPRYPKIINRLTSLLIGGMEDFAPSGFPPAGERLPMEIPDPEKLDLPLPSANFKVGCEAACWSGMVPSHAEAFAKVAGEENKVILVRPVNPDATPLIEMNAATKGMTLKGKSSNWGPQKGYITENQKFSKIWQQYKENPDTRKKEITDYDKKVQELLMEDPDIATRRHLELVYIECETDSFFVYVKSDEPNAEQALFLATDTTATSNYYKWDINDTDGCPIDENNPENNLESLVALNVIANPTPDLVIDGKPRYYTADYDLLAIGFYDQRLAGNQKDLCPYPTLPPFNNKTGLITPEQSALLDILNGTVKTEAMYEGGNVSHHGPENQFYVLAKPIKGSPYVDYPITAFYPETKRSKKGKIMSIPRGPAGFRDIYLKRFMAEKRREGYDLYDNIHSPGWKWRDLRPYSYGRGWADRDAPGLMDSPEEIPFPDNCNCDKSKIGIDTYQKELDLLAQPIMRGKREEVLLFPNPTTQRISSSIISKKEESINYNILDQVGRAVGSGTVSLSIGRNDISIDVSHLSEGIYFLTLSSEGKMVSRSFIVGQ